MKDINATSIEDRKEFIFCGDTLKQCEHNETTGLWLYERYNPKGRLVGYEVVKGKKRKNPDGSEVLCYPSSDDFGSYGLAYPPCTNRASLVRSLDIPMNSDTRDERRKAVTYDFYFDRRGRKISVT